MTTQVEGSTMNKNQRLIASYARLLTWSLNHKQHWRHSAALSRSYAIAAAVDDRTPHVACNCPVCTAQRFTAWQEREHY